MEKLEEAKGIDRKSTAKKNHFEFRKPYQTFVETIAAREKRNFPTESMP